MLADAHPAANGHPHQQSCSAGKQRLDFACPLGLVLSPNPWFVPDRPSLDGRFVPPQRLICDSLIAAPEPGGWDRKQDSKPAN